MKNVMLRAWEIKKEFDRKEKKCKLNHCDRTPLKEEEKALFSECLKIAWAELKEESSKKQIPAHGNKAIVKDWFLVEKCGGYADTFSPEIEILKETAKAVYGNIYSNVTGVPMAIWCPKSCLA